MLQLFVYVYVLIPNEALWWEEADYACVYGINESARAHCKICPKINGRNITLIYVKRIVRWMCTNCQKLKRNGIDIKSLRKRRKETAKEWVTASVCVYVWQYTERDRRKGKVEQMFESYDSLSNLGITLDCRSHANRMQDEQIQLNRSLNTITQMHGKSEKERASKRSHASAVSVE